MDFLNFLARNALASLVGAIGLIFLALGYADQAKNIWEAAEPWQLQGLGAAFFILAVILMLFRYDQAHANASKSAFLSLPSAVPDTVAVVRPSSLEKGPTAAQAPHPQAGASSRVPSGEIYAGDRVTGRSLRLICEGKTTHQQRLIVAPYLGKWIKVSGTVRNVTPSDYGGWSVSLAEDDRQIAETTQIQFRIDQIPFLETLSAGDRIAALGKIDRVDEYTVRLTDAFPA